MSSRQYVDCLALPAWRCLPGAACLALPAWRCLPSAACLALPAWRCLPGAACLALPAWRCVAYRAQANGPALKCCTFNVRLAFAGAVLGWRGVHCWPEQGWRLWAGEGPQPQGLGENVHEGSTRVPAPWCHRPQACGRYCEVHMGVLAIPRTPYTCTPIPFPAICSNT
jgi:hypothetical protein